MSKEEENQQRLEAQRAADAEKKRELEVNKQKKSLGKLANEIAREAEVTDTEHLRKFIQLTDFFFAIAIMSSLLKDIVDFVANAVPGLQLLGVVTAFMAGIITWAAMLLCGAGLRQSKKRSMIKSIFTPDKWKVLIAGTVLEMLPIIDFLPLETITTFVIFILILKNRREAAAEEQREAARMTAAYAYQD